MQNEDDPQTTQTTERATPIPVFWTGGVDSTFRVLDLAIHYACRVQPVYVRDPARRSLQNELDTIRKITERVASNFPEAGNRILPLVIVERGDIPNDPEVTRKYRLLRELEEISWQYEWLANVSSVTGYRNIELGIKGITPLFRLLKENSERFEYPCGTHSYRLKSWSYANQYEEGASLFSAFSLPILQIDKAELESLAADHGFTDLLKLSWFCHYPWGDEPCGACGVCRSFISDNGLLTMPSGTRIRNKMWFVIHPTRLLLSNPGQFVARFRDKATWAKSKRTRN